MKPPAVFLLVNIRAAANSWPNGVSTGINRHAGARTDHHNSWTGEPRPVNESLAFSIPFSVVHSLSFLTVHAVAVLVPRHHLSGFFIRTTATRVLNLFPPRTLSLSGLVSARNIGSTEDESRCFGVITGQRVSNSPALAELSEILRSKYCVSLFGFVFPACLKQSDGCSCAKREGHARQHAIYPRQCSQKPRFLTPLPLPFRPHSQVAPATDAPVNPVEPPTPQPTVRKVYVRHDRAIGMLSLCCLRSDVWCDHSGVHRNFYPRKTGLSSTSR